MTGIKNQKKKKKKKTKSAVCSKKQESHKQPIVNHTYEDPRHLD